MAFVAICAHQFWPQFKFDGPTLFLIAVAVVPWLGHILKSLEFPGGFKFEFREMQEVKKRAEEAGLLRDEPMPRQEEAAFLSVANRDPNLALAGLRIEVENRLRDIAREKDIQANNLGVGPLLGRLRQAQIISLPEASVLADILPLLNQAVHGAKVTPEAVAWAMDIGPKVLVALDERLRLVKETRTHEVGATTS